MPTEPNLDDLLDHRIVAINFVIGDLDTMAHLIDVPEQHDEYLAARRNLEASRDALVTIKRYRHPEGLSDGQGAQPPGPDNQQLTSEGSATNAANPPQDN